MAKKKAAEKPKTERILKLATGSEFTVTGEDGRYWICGPVMFRKSNPDIICVTDVQKKNECGGGANAES